MLYHQRVPSKLFSICFIFFALVCTARAQEGARPGALRGVVVDEGGAPVAGALVTLIVHRSMDITGVKTDGDGRFELIVTGDYPFTLMVTAKGFARFERAWKEGEWDGSELRVVLVPPGFAERVTVTAARTETRLAETAASVVVLGEEELESASALTADDVLRQVPGFQLFRRTSSRAANPTAQGVSLRGVGASGASRAVVLYDGVPLNDPFGGWVYWGRVPREGLGRVEVLRGASSALYGSGALGGVVQFVPRKTEETQLRFETSYGTQRTPDASVYASTLRGGWGLSLSAQTFSTGGYVLVDKRERGRVDTPAASRNAYGDLYVGRDITKGLHVFARPSYYGESRRNGTPLQFNRTHLRQFAAGMTWDSTRVGVFDLRAHGSAQVFDQSFTSIAADRASEALTRLQRVPAQGSGLSLQWSRSAGARHALVAGFEWSEARGASDELVYVAGRPSSLVGAGGRARIAGFYARDAVRVTDRLVVTPGVRFDRWRNYRAQQTTRALTGTRAVSTVGFEERTETAFSPQLSAVFKLSDALSVNATFARAFRAPTLNELYRSFRVGNVFTLADENLRAERLTSGEAGLLFNSTRRGMAARANLFWMDVTRPVANVTLSVTPALITRQRRNLGRTRSRGFEAEFEQRLGHDWTASAGYLFADARVARFPVDVTLEGRRLPQVARQQLSFQLRHAGRTTFALQGRASSAQFDDDQNLLRLGGYFTLDAFISRRLGHGFEVFAAAENLNGQRYDAGRTPVLTVGPPAFARVGVRLRLGGN
ncbi:MAG: iron complex outerrane recepter protein [Acidobacteriota bacterium]|jgi:outer membrane receptor protein involved in Fe transport|nr:iron complex outerrane recepter protein [Acidobacteriota bacterium]